MKRLAVLLVVIAAAAVLAAPAGARIVPGQSIAGVKLSMTKAQVRGVLGEPTTIAHGANEFGTFTVFKYFRLSVTFQGNATVTAIKTNRKVERTRHDIGVGSTRAQVLAKVAGVRCFRSVKSQHTVEERDLGSHLHHFALLRVEVAFGRGDEQPQEYGGHGRDEAHGQFHRVLGVRAQLILGKVTTDTPS